MNSGRIDCIDSYFWYAVLADPDAKCCEDFQDPSFVPLFEIDFGNDTALKERAENLCGGTIDDKGSQNCLFDFFVTKNEDLAAATLSTQIAGAQASSAAGNVQRISMEN